MLSNIDIKKELGKNIFIFPITESSIKSNSIDLKASKFAWSISTKKSIFDGDKTLVIPKNDTVLIYTQESIFVSNKIGGSYHSKVRLVSHGIGHIGTTLDAQYIGLSIIALHNNTNGEFRIAVGSEIVSIMFETLFDSLFTVPISTVGTYRVFIRDLTYEYSISFYQYMRHIAGFSACIFYAT